MASGLRVSCRATAIAIALIAFAATGVAHAPSYPEPSLLTCPDTAAIDPRQGPLRDHMAVRLLAPKTGAATSADLAGHAGLAASAYRVFEAFQAGKDATQAMPEHLRPLGLILGDPGPDTERGARRLRDTRTLYGFVADDRATAQRVVVFRGTLQPNEWLRNLQAGQRSYPLGREASGASARVHAGFLKIFESLEFVAGDTKTPLSAALPGLVAGKDTAFIGHSLGGALATLAGVEAALRAPQDAPRLRVVTFASPRVGDRAFAALAQSVGRIDRVCNVVDIVPAIPASTPRIDYIHVGEVFRLSSFDWPELGMVQTGRGEQIACWHSIETYGYMLSPAKTTAGLDGCVAP